MKLEIRPAPRVAPRVPIQPIHRVTFRPLAVAPGSLEQARLCNISVSGVGLLATDLKPVPEPGALIEGSLVFEQGSFPVKLRAVHVTQGVLGLSYEGDSRGLRDAIRAYFEVELAALGMLKINPAHHKPEPDGQGHWIHGDQCELYYVVDATGTLLRFRLTFVGNRLTWDALRGLAVGQVADTRGGIMRTDTLVEAELTAETIVVAGRFLQNIKDLPAQDRERIGKLIAAPRPATAA